MTAKTGERIAGLDGLRALAVLMVFLDHRVDAVKPFHLGGYGVRIFFVLSGFLIVGILHRERATIEAGARSVWDCLVNFYYRRSMRIFPIYYLCLGIAALASLLFSVEHFTSAELPYYLSFMTNIYVGQKSHTWVGPFSHLWSLAAEEQFYLLAAPVALLLPAKALQRACIVVVVAGSAWHMHMVLEGRTAIELGMDPLSNFSLIAIGGAMALQPLKAGSGSNRGVQQGVLLALCLFTPFAIHEGFANPVLRQVAFPLVVAYLLFEMRQGQQSGVVALLDLKPLAALGRISYGFYLYHAFVTLEALRAATGGIVDLEQLNAPLRPLVLFAVSVGLAALSWRWVEKPLMSWSRREEPSAALLLTSIRSQRGSASGAMTSLE